MTKGLDEDPGLKAMERGSTKAQSRAAWRERAGQMRFFGMIASLSRGEAAARMSIMPIVTRRSTFKLPPHDLKVRSMPVTSYYEPAFDANRSLHRSAHTYSST